MGYGLDSLDHFSLKRLDPGNGVGSRAYTPEHRTLVDGDRMRLK